MSDQKTSYERYIEYKNKKSNKNVLSQERQREEELKQNLKEFASINNDLLKEIFYDYIRTHDWMEKFTVEQKHILIEEHGEILFSTASPYQLYNLVDYDFYSAREGLYDHIICYIEEHGLFSKNKS